MHEDNGETHRSQAGRWTKEEHQRFMYAIMQYGKDWKKVEQYVKTRSGSQVRSHAQKFFNKLQKTNQSQDQLPRSHQEFSETEFDIERQLNNEATPSTPLQLVSLIKKQSKEEGGRVNLDALKKRLDQRNEQVKIQSQQNLKQSQEGNGVPEALRKHNSYKSMSNILSAYGEINEENKSKQVQDESFLILLTKKYKKYFGKFLQFQKLIDINNNPVQQHPNPIRKRSFTLPQGTQLSGDQLQEKIEEIKKQINTQHPSHQKIAPSKEEKKQRKEGSQQKNEELLPLNRLATIQEQAKQDEEYASFKAIPLPDNQENHEEGRSPQKTARY